MPHSFTNYLDRPFWDNPRKVKSRLVTIVEPYREFFGVSLPSNKQYWTMCGAYYDEMGNKIDGEMGQLIGEGLFTPEQFRGVDIDAKVRDTNHQLYPNVKWICGDFKDSMENAAIDGKFHPAVINFDGIWGAKFGTKYLHKILKFIDYNVPDKLMLSANFVLRNPYRIKDGTISAEDLLSYLLKIYTFPDHWQILPFYYIYLGGASSRSSSIMGSITFVKRPHKLVEYNKTNRRLDVAVA